MDYCSYSGGSKPFHAGERARQDPTWLLRIAILQDHDKLNLIMINGRVKKASSKDRVKPATDLMSYLQTWLQLRIFVALEDPQGRARIGHVDLETPKVTTTIT